ncbi:MAG: quinolinate synthase NadA [Desulfobacterales bacterium]|jgi:quinolinate synthase
MNALQEQIRRLLEEKHAVLLAHNYQPPDIQEVADFCGDSLELSLKASKTDAEVIVFCGVHFMAETANILSPEKTVLLPRADAGCPMADMVTPEALEIRMAELPGVPVVTYVNSSAAVKALSTICCTSANAVEVVNSLDVDTVLMVPDRNLAMNTAARVEKTIHYWAGFCPFHDILSADALAAAKSAHPEAEVMVHPECPPEVVAMADVVVSTSGMIRHAMQSSADAFIVGTEVGMAYPLRKACPDKTFHMASERMHCEDMKKITLEDVAASLRDRSGEVRVPEDIRRRAYVAVQKMIDLSS